MSVKDINQVDKAAEDYAYSQVPNPQHYVSDYYTTGDRWDDAKDHFKAGASYQSSRMFSLEDMLECWHSGSKSAYDCVVPEGACGFDHTQHKTDFENYFLEKHSIGVNKIKEDEGSR